VKSFKRGDLVVDDRIRWLDQGVDVRDVDDIGRGESFDSGVGLVLETETRRSPFPHHHNDDYKVCKVLFCDGIEWMPTKGLHEPRPFLKMKPDDV